MQCPLCAPARLELQRRDCSKCNLEMFARRAIERKWHMERFSRAAPWIFVHFSDIACHRLAKISHTVLSVSTE
jgi:hypothetical protein